MLTVYLYMHPGLLALAGSRLASAASAVTGRLRGDERGQTSAEYALVLLGAAAIALLIVAWATQTDLIGKLFDAVVNAITGKVK
jgi:Flp pilus assembly pilin Flp